MLGIVYKQNYAVLRIYLAKFNFKYQITVNELSIENELCVCRFT